MDNFIKLENHGFIIEPIIETDYILGDNRLTERFAFSNKVVRQDGQWDAYLPEREMQWRIGIETMNCTNYGTLNALETLHNALYGVLSNWSERYLGVMSGTTQNGNSANSVAETVRKAGCIPEKELPFDDTIKSWAQYYSPKPMERRYIDMGKQWLDKVNFGHEYVFQASEIIASKQERLIEALKYSPCGVSVRAWQMRNGLYWKDKGTSDNHWCCCYGYEKDKYWKIYDSYDNTNKRLEWNYDFQYAKRYFLELKIQEEKTMNKLVRKKNNKEVFLQIGNKRYWIKDEKNFSELSAGGLIGSWNAIEEVEEFATPFEGDIIGSPNLADVLKNIFGIRK